MDRKLEAGIWFLILIIIIVSLWPRGYDDTDDVTNEVRSGMMLFIDHGTGCHYLAARAFLGYTELTPRLDRTGRHVCKGEG